MPEQTNKDSVQRYKELKSVADNLKVQEGVAKRELANKEKEYKEHIAWLKEQGITDVNNLPDIVADLKQQRDDKLDEIEKKLGVAQSEYDKLNEVEPE